jgi:hypothetical protein
MERMLLSIIENQIQQLNNIAKMVKNLEKKPKSDIKTKANLQILKMLKPNNHGRR